MVGTIITVPSNETLIAYAIGLPSLIFILWIYWGTYYELRQNYLYCRSGPFFEKIPYEKIASLRLCQSILASMALSTQRIEIRQHGKGYILGTSYISPLKREEFLQELTQRCKNLSE
jgi:hypothetical protein